LKTHSDKHDREPPAEVSPVEALAGRIQLLPNEVRWLYAQPDVVRDRALRTTSSTGLWRRTAEKLLALVGPTGLAAPVVYAIALAVALGIWVRSLRYRPTGGEVSVFVGIGALNDASLREELSRVARDKEIVSLNETDLGSFGRVLRPKFRTVLTSFRVTREHVAKHLHQSKVAEFGQRDLQTWAMLRMGAYVFFHAWFRDFEVVCRPQLIAMSAASYVSFAAVNASGPVIYVPHGFQRRSLIFPDFTEVHVSTSFDAFHFRERLPGTTIRSLRAPSPLDGTERLALIAGHYGDVCELKRAESFIEWALGCKYPITIRPHPRDQTGYWDRWRGVQGITFDDASESIDSVLTRLKPRLLVTWASTTLLDALVRGVIPVTLAGAEARERDLVFPLRDLALGWPDERITITKLACDAELADAYSDGLRSTVLLEQP
jgi:hypothetical protein